MTKIKVKIQKDDGSSEPLEALLRFTITDSVFQLTLTEPNNIVEHSNASNLWDGVLGIRKALEAKNLRLLCNVSRINANVSAAYRNSGGGSAEVYLVSLGEPAYFSDQVDMFGFTPLSETGTVMEQRNFLQEWVKSL